MEGQWLHGNSLATKKILNSWIGIVVLVDEFGLRNRLSIDNKIPDSLSAAMCPRPTTGSGSTILVVDKSEDQR